MIILYLSFLLNKSENCWLLMQVVNFLPRALFINRIGRSIILSEYHNDTEEPLQPYEPPKLFQWQSEFGNELLKVTNLDG
jgi:hypothetical protein